MQARSPLLLAASIEFNVGKEEIVNFLSKLGFTISNNNSAQLTLKMYEALKSEFSNKSVVDEMFNEISVNSQKPEVDTISIDSYKAENLNEEFLAIESKYVNTLKQIDEDQRNLSAQADNEVNALNEDIPNIEQEKSKLEAEFAQEKKRIGHQLNECQKALEDEKKHLEELSGIYIDTKQKEKNKIISEHEEQENRLKTEIELINYFFNNKINEFKKEKESVNEKYKNEEVRLEQAIKNIRVAAEEEKAKKENEHKHVIAEMIESNEKQIAEHPYKREEKQLLELKTSLERQGYLTDIIERYLLQEKLFQISSQLLSFTLITIAIFLLANKCNISIYPEFDSLIDNITSIDKNILFFMLLLIVFLLCIFTLQITDKIKKLKSLRSLPTEELRIDHAKQFDNSAQIIKAAQEAESRLRAEIKRIELECAVQKAKYILQQDSILDKAITEEGNFEQTLMQLTREANAKVTSIEDEILSNEEKRKNEINKIDKKESEKEHERNQKLSDINKEIRKNNIQKDTVIGNLDADVKKSEREKQNKIDNCYKILSEKQIAIEKVEEDLSATDKKYKAKIKEVEKSIADTFEKIRLKRIENDNKMYDFEQKKQMQLIELESTCVVQINQVIKTADNFMDLFNQQPETFDSNFAWENVQKNKQNILNKWFRLGKTITTIHINDKPYNLDIPQFISFLDTHNILINCYNNDETSKAKIIANNIIARILLALPANNVKLTFIDYLNSGLYAGAFSKLPTEIKREKVFTNSNDIETQLSELQNRIANTTQHCLIDGYQNISEYNLANNETPEPYRFVVIYNFPHGFNQAAQKFNRSDFSPLSILLKNGPQAGVHTIMIIDRNYEIPEDKDWNPFSDINLNYFREINLSQIEYDKTLPINDIVNYIKKEFANASSRKISFKKYLPSEIEWWKDDSGTSIKIPIGKRGRDIQYLQFDLMGSNQALIIGKSGSGKSNLLHIIIENSLWKYSPDQLEMYLIDFKEGVAFGRYAGKGIPHIKSIVGNNIESSISIIRYISDIVDKRNQLFREKHVEDIEKYHKKFPNDKMPRILLIIDELPRLYNNDNNISDEASSLQINILRQGRSAGINTLVATQTLAGIPMAIQYLFTVHIVLKCDAGDADNIFGNSNNAAKDLSIPGQGIYYTKPNVIEKYQSFCDNEDEACDFISKVADFSKNRNYNQENLPFVFFGNEQAQLETLDSTIRKIIRIKYPQQVNIWLGTPITIAEDVSFVLKKEIGENILISGNDNSLLAPLGLQIIVNSIISIAAHHEYNSAKIYLFNFTSENNALFDVPDKYFSILKQKYSFVDIRIDILNTLKQIKDEIKCRIQSENAHEFEHIYLAFVNFQNARSFKSNDDAIQGEEIDILKIILDEGPNLGVFSILHIDSIYNNNFLDQENITKFNYRILGNMSRGEYGFLTDEYQDVNIANNLAILHRKINNNKVKFKPYELPNFRWVSNLSNPQSKLS